MVTGNTSTTRAARVRQWQQQRQDQIGDALERERTERERAYAERQASVAETAEDDAVRDANGWTRGISTAADVGANVLFGVADFLEGIADLGLGIAGGVGGLFNEDFRNETQKLIQFDATREWLEDPLDEAGLKYSYLNDGTAGEIIGEVARGVGNMLPNLALTVATGGAVNPATMQAINIGTLSASAAGGGMEDAFNDGADYGQGFLYGLGSGLVEGTTEKFFGAGTEKLFGRGLLDGTGGAIAATGARRVVKNALEEAGEEAVSALVDPALKTVYKGTDALREYGSSDFYGEVGKSALVGGLTSVAYGATVGQAANFSGKDADIADTLSELQTIETKRNKLSAKGHLSEAVQTTLAQAEAANLHTIERTLQSVNEKKRAALMRRHGLSEAFDASGKLRTAIEAQPAGETTASDLGDGEPAALATTERVQTDAAEDGAATETTDAGRRAAVARSVGEDARNARTDAAAVASAKGNTTRAERKSRASQPSETSVAATGERAVQTMQTSEAAEASNAVKAAKAAKAADNGQGGRTVKTGDALQDADPSQPASATRVTLSDDVRLSHRQRTELSEEFSAMKNGYGKVHRTVDGEYLFALREDRNDRGRARKNTVVYVTETEEGLSVRKVVRLNGKTDTEVAIQRDRLFRDAYKSSGKTQTAQRTNTAQASNAAQGADTVQGADTAQGANTAQASKAAQRTNTAQGAKSVQGAKAVQGADTVQGANTAQRTNTAQHTDADGTHRRQSGTRAASETTKRATEALREFRTLRKNGNPHTERFYADERFARAMETFSDLPDTQAAEKKIKRALGDLAQWYRPSNRIFEGQSEMYRRDIADRLRRLSERSGSLTDADVRDLLTVKAHIEYMVKTHRTVVRNGERTDAVALSSSYIKCAQHADAHRSGVGSKLFENSYTRMSADPVSLARYADHYDETGFYTETFSDFQRGSVDVAVTNMELTEGERNFRRDHRGYTTRLKTETVVFREQTLPLSVGISLYMSAKRKQAQRGLVEYGCTVEWEEKRTRLPPLGTKETGGYSDAECQRLCAELGSTLEKQFNETDRAYIATLEDAFRRCGALKAETDRQRFGYSNVSEEDAYFPIVRADVVASNDLLETVSSLDLDTADLLSVNRTLEAGASGALLVGAADRMFSDHVRKIALYSGFALKADKFNRIFELNVAEDGKGKKERPISVKTVTEETKFGRALNDYLKRLKQDIERFGGDATSSRPRSKLVRKLRQSYATYQLGVNPKVWAGQLSSFFAAHNLLDVDCIIKGFGLYGEDVDQYCALAKLRNTENTAALSQSVADRVTALGELTMKPIGWADRMVIKKLFCACQLQIAKQDGGTVGTEANKRAAGALLERVILETQQNALATERSDAMRSDSELLRSFTMFTADSVKVFGRFLDAFGETLTRRGDLKRARQSGTERKAAERRLKAAKKQLRRSVVSLTSGAVWMSCLAMLVSHFRGRSEDKDTGEQVADFLLDTLGNMIGGLPVLSDVYNFFTQGYEVDTMTVSMANDLLYATDRARSLLCDVISGKTVTRQEAATTVRKVVYAAGEVLGIPVRNLYNDTIDLFKRTSTSAEYRVNDLFVRGSYRSDLQKALEAGDEKLVGTIADLMLDERVETEDQEVRAALRSLTEAGYSVLPRAVGDTVTVGGEQRELTREEREQLRSAYAETDDAVCDLVRMSAFRSASEAEQAKAIRLLYDLGYALALEDVTGVGSDRKRVLFARAMDPAKLALVLAVVGQMKADTDRDGSPVNGSKKEKITAYIASLDLSAAEKYMLMGYLGYKNVHGAEAVQAYLARTSLSREERTELLADCGYGN